MSTYFDVTLKDVVEKPDFYMLEPTFFGSRRYLDEIRRLDYAAHLLRVELFRLKLAEMGAQPEWIERHRPRYIEPAFPPNIHQKAIHSNLLRQVEYLRAEVLFTAVRIARPSRQVESVRSDLASHSP